MEKIIIQITSGRGPVECCRVVAKVQEKILAHARKLGIVTEVLDSKKADLKGTLLSAAILAKSPGGAQNSKSVKDSRDGPGSADLQAFIKEWRGTVQCLERLEQKILAWQTSQLISQQQTRWQEHNALERGNAVKTISEDL